MRLTTSEIDFLQIFEKNFLKYSNMPIALYGIGEKTKLLLKEKEKYNIIGLMDKDTVGDIIYGVRVLSYEEVIEKVKLIIIVANLVSCNTIYKRIEFLKKLYGIEIIYVNGTIPQEADIALENSPYWKKGINALKQEIDNNEIISFDIFDTLIMRKVLYPTDVFDIMEDELIRRYNINIDFKRTRIKAEKLCYMNKKCYNIDEIYVELNKYLKMETNLLSIMKELEFEIELNNCVSREAVVDCFNYAISQNKMVFLITDMYWKKKYIQKLLDNLNISGYKEIIISCECGESKHSGDLWETFAKKYVNKSILHIGDNLHSDIQIPQKYNINTFEIKNAVDLIEMSALRELGYKSECLNSNLILGQFIAKALNNPFILNKYYGKLPIDNMFDLGFLIFGPLVLNFMIWLINKVKENSIDKLLFFARDGYILKNVYDRISEKLNAGYPESIYFLTSRRAASVAAIYEEEDIEFIIKNMCKTKKVKVTELIFRAFGITPKRESSIGQKQYFEITQDELIAYVINNYKEEILINSKEENETYLKYIKGLRLKVNEKIGCVNFVGRGITQKYIETLLERELTGYYFATEIDMENIFKTMDNKYGVYGELISPHISKSYFVSNYLFGEVIFSSPDEQLIKFDSGGNPVFDNAEEKRDFSGIQKCQLGIEKFVEEILNLDNNLLKRSLDLDVIDQLYGLLVTNKCVFSEEIKKYFVFNDYYNPSIKNVKLDLF